MKVLSVHLLKLLFLPHFWQKHKCSFCNFSIWINCEFLRTALFCFCIFRKSTHLLLTSEVIHKMDRNEKPKMKKAEFMVWRFCFPIFIFLCVHLVSHEFCEFKCLKMQQNIFLYCVYWPCQKKEERTKRTNKRIRKENRLNRRV